MVAESNPDADGEVLSRLRRALGPAFPIVVTFDLHGNLSQKQIDNCDLALAYRTCPHIDQEQCGLQAALLLRMMLKKQFQPVQALAGVAVPWFGQPGGGTAYMLPKSIDELISDGVLVEVRHGTPPPTGSATYKP